MIKRGSTNSTEITETAKDVRQGAMRLDVGPKFVTQNSASPPKRASPSPLEIKIFRQPNHFITSLFQPFREERLLAGALPYGENYWNNFRPTVNPALAVKPYREVRAG